MRIKLLQICFGDGYAGSAKMAVLSSELLMKKGVEVLFLATKGSLTESRTIGKGIKTISLDSSQPFKIVQDEVFKVYDNFKPSVVISHHSLDRKLGIKLRTRYKKEFINVGYRHNLSQSAPVIGALLYNYYFDYLIACGSGVGKSLTKSGIFKKKVKVIHYGIEIPENIKEISGESIRQKYSLHDKVVLGVSAWFHKQRKGFDILFKAYSALDEKYILFIIGIPDEMKQEVWNYAAEFNIIQNRIVMPGYVENIFEYYKAMDIFIFPSRSEGFPLAPLEAGAANLPIIASDIPGTNEFINSSVNGILYKTEDYRALTSAVKELSSNPGLRKEYAAKAFQTVINNYTSEIYGDKLYQNLTEFLNHKRL